MNRFLGWTSLLGPLAAVALAPPSHGQVPAVAATEPEPDLAAITRAMRAAHRDADAPARVDSFHAQIAVTPIGQKAEDRVTVQLDVRFRAGDRSRGKRARLHYSVNQGDRRIERASGSFMWQRLGAGEEVKNLGERAFAEDRKALERELRLAAQLLRYVEPDAIARELTAPSVEAVRRKLPGEAEAKPFWLIEGRSQSFPLYSEAGEYKSVQLRLLVERDTHRLRALGATPLDAKGQPTEQNEWVVLRTLRRQDGLLLPSHLQITSEDKAAGTAGSVKVEVNSIRLNPELDDRVFEPGG